MPRSLPLSALPLDVQAKLRKAGKRSAESSRVAVFLALLKEQGLPQPHREFKFHPVRLWRFDYAWVAWQVALEVDGGIWRQGRHTRGSGWLKDTEKLNAAASMGWRLLRCAPQQLTTDELLNTLRTALAWRPL